MHGIHSLNDTQNASVLNLEFYTLLLP